MPQLFNGESLDWGVVRGIFLSLLLGLFSAFAEPEKEKSLLVKNVVLVDSDGGGEDQLISLLIKNGKLDMVTKESGAEKEIDLVVDAQQGIVLGKLNVGEPASFMILDEDPRVNFDALLDTQTHAVFVLKEGVIVRNRLLPAPLEPGVPSSEKPKEWFAYSAPPIALSTSYKNAGKWNRLTSKYINGTFIGAVVLDRMAWLDQGGTSETQVGDLSSYDGGEIRGLRFGVVGTLNFDKPWIYTFAAATHAFDKGFDIDTTDSIGLFDLRLDIPFYADTSLAIGKQKEPISMERLTGMINLPMQERAAVSDAMMPSRNIGVVLSGTGFDRRTTWAGGLFNPWIDLDVSIDEAPTQLIGRGTWLPLLSTDEGSLVHLGAGARYSNVKQGAHYFSEPEFNQSPVFVDTTLFPADSSMLYDLEAAWRWGPFLLNGEYMISQIEAPTVGNPTFTGYHLTASYVLTGEMRPYNKRSGLFRPVPMSKSVASGGWGAWEVMTRISNIDLNEGAVSGGDMDIYSLGINWWLSTSASVGINYRHIILDDIDGTGHSDGLMTRIVLMLE